MLWYADGDVVLDRLLGVSRADQVDVHVLSDAVRIAEIRDALDVRPDQTLAIRTSPRAIVCSLDQLVLLPNGLVVDRDTEAPFSDEQVECALVALDVAAQDALRLYRWMRRYPEVRFEPAVRRRIHAEHAQLVALSQRSAEAEVLLYSELWSRESP